MPKVSFILVNYNTRDLLQNAIQNLLGIYPDMEIIVVDNASTDGSFSMVREAFSTKVKLISQENKGLAAGNNLAFHVASGDYLIYVGTDAYPKPEAIRQMVDFMESNKDVGICTPKLVLRSGKPDMDAHRGFPTPATALIRFMGLHALFPNSRFFGHYFLSYLDMTTRHEIDLCITHFMVVRQSAHRAVGDWDEQFFLYGEDVDFCYRMKQNGYKIVYLGDIEVLHYKGAGHGRSVSKDIKNAASTSKEVVANIPSYSTQAMRLFVTKHYKNKYPTWLVNLMFLGMSLILGLRKFLTNFK